MDDSKSDHSADHGGAITAPWVLVAEGLYLRFPQRELFKNLSLRVPAGITLVRGGESTGKTSLLRVLAGALAPDRGTVAIHGTSLQGDPAAYRQQVFWNDPRSDAYDQLIVSGYLQSQQQRHPGFDAHKLAQLAADFSLTGHMHKPLYMLSTGSKRKVWLAAAFASGAAVTLLDDPFAGLDSASVQSVLALLRDAAVDPARACIVADYEVPAGVPLASVVDLGD